MHFTLESGDENSHDEEGNISNIKRRDSTSLYRSSGAGAAMMKLLAASVSSLHQGFKQCGPEKGRIFAASGAAGVGEFDLKLNTLSSDGDGDWDEKKR